jgi:acyl carrier protein
MSPRERLRAAIARELGQPVGALPDALGVRDVVPDSYALVELVLRLQELTGVQLDGETMGRVVTVGELLDVFTPASQARDADDPVWRAS